MQVTQLLAARCALLEGGRGAKIVAVCGPAGSGKTTFSGRLASDLEAQGVRSVVYSGDWRFFLDSAQRKRRIEEARRLGMNEYMGAINQNSWWDFGAVEEDLRSLATGNPLRIRDAYDRATGRKDLDVTIPAGPYGAVIYENAILGGDSLLGLCDAVVLLCTEEEECFRGVLDKDRGRRRPTEIAARYLITSFYESVHFTDLRAMVKDRLIVCDRQGNLGEFKPTEFTHFVPIPADLVPGQRSGRARNGATKVGCK